MESLRNKIAGGIFWSLLDSFGVYLVKFGFSIVIARTLSPEDYGLMGMIVIFISLGQMIMQGGFSMALIQKKDASSADMSTAFWFNLVIALIVYLILFLSAGAIADFYDKPLLVPITRTAAIGIIINSLCSVQNSILSISMDFRKLTWINMAGAVVSGSTGLLLALRGYAVWALVFQTLAGNIIYLAGLWITTKWRPQFLFSLQSFRSLFGFGYKILLQGLTDVIFTKSYFPLIGKLFPVAQLGYYTNASRFYELFIRQTSNSVTRVIFPAFSRIKDDGEKFGSNYVRSFNLLALVMYLGSLVLVISSRSFVAIALTDKWLPAVPFMQIFFLEGFVFPLMMFNQNILYAAGKGSAALKIDMVRKAVMLAGIFILYRYGIKALIAGQVFSTLVALVASGLALSGIHGINYMKMIMPLFKLILIAGSCFIISHFLIESLQISDWAELAIKVTLIPAAYLGMAALAAPETVHELGAFLKNFRTGKAAA